MMRPFANDDLIAAIATARGSAGVGIVRVSGPDQEIRELAQTVLKTTPQPRHALYTPFYDSKQTVLDEGLALYFPAPHSFTGESVLELQAHGGCVILDCLLAEVLQQGARLANPGEFSLRAFCNGKLDLLQAEAVSDLISAGSEVAARSATRSLQGEFSKRVQHLLGQLIELRRYVEAAIDFSEEEIDFLGEGQVLDKLQSLRLAVAELLQGAQQGSLLQHGANLAIVGEPNVGKSSLLNRLTATDTAIVTDIAGTTRDVLREQIQIDGLPIHLVDTAGLRETDDRVEQAGIERSWREVEQADCILFVFDLSTVSYPQRDGIYAQIKLRVGEKVPVIAVGNKQDQVQREAVDNLGEKDEFVAISAKTGLGVDQLAEKIKSLVGFQSTMESPFIARRRHVVALQRVQQRLDDAVAPAQAHLGDCMAEELRYAQQALSELTGEMTSDDLLGEIFSNFCVGK
jgi:tRNA modification GTPase